MLRVTLCLDLAKLWFKLDAGNFQLFVGSGRDQSDQGD